MTFLSALTRAADAPAHEAVRLSRAPILQTLAPGAIGLVGLSLSALALAALRDQPSEVGSALGALVEALATITPLTLVVAAFGPLASPRVVGAGVALGLLTAGWVALGLVPLAAFTALVSPRTGWALDAFGLLVSVAALASVATVLARVLLAIDRGFATRVAVTVFALATFGVFAARAEATIGRVMPW